jgi:hypothetical protein
MGLPLGADAGGGTIRILPICGGATAIPGSIEDGGWMTSR